MIRLDVNQDVLEPAERLSEALFGRIERAVSEREQPEGVIALRFVSDGEIQRLNRMYRQQDRVTDVLSFSYMKDPGELLGDVAISFEQAKRQATGAVEHEVVTLIVHGILHVLGYDHEDPNDANVMFPLQDAIVDKLII